LQRLRRRVLVFGVRVQSPPADTLRAGRQLLKHVACREQRACKGALSVRDQVAGASLAHDDLRARGRSYLFSVFWILVCSDGISFTDRITV
jgi:hypothetical protein